MQMYAGDCPCGCYYMLLFLVFKRHSTVWGVRRKKPYHVLVTEDVSRSSSQVQEGPAQAHAFTLWLKSPDLCSHNGAATEPESRAWAEW